MKTILLFITVLLMTACATAPKLQLDEVNQSLNPNEAVTEITSHKGTKVLWGGIIISSKNVKQGTLLEVLAYPLEDNYEPDTEKSPLGRFLGEYPQYLETVDYAAGRMVTVVGPIMEVRTGIIGEAEYQYPVIGAEQLHLWPTADQKSDTRIQFGIGVMIHN